MRKRIAAGLVVGLLLLALGVWWFTRTKTPSTPPTRTTTVKKQSQPRVKKQPLTLATWQQQPRLAYASIIYYAVKHLKIQRWQEVSDFDRGWQVEFYSSDQPVKYLVWPDKNIKADAKQLQPNWFTLDAHHQVTYDSFGVHTFAKDMTATVSATKIINQIHADHAVGRVYQMLDNLAVKRHR